MSEPYDSRQVCAQRGLLRVAAALLLLALACSAAEAGSSPPVLDRDFTASPSIETSPAPRPSGGANSADLAQGTLLPDSAESPAAGAAPACVTVASTAALEREPVDIILVLDNSGSMRDEIDAVERNINVNFARVLEDAEVDYRVILISRHRRDVRGPSGEASTSICVQEPLSTLEDCPADAPGLSDRFFHYSIKIESTDSFERIAESLNQPLDRFDLTVSGWSEWLRPGAKKVFLELSDDDAETSVADFLRELTTRAPEHFGTDPGRPAFVFHSIVGVVERSPAGTPYLPADPVESTRCTGNDNNVENAGETYQELSRMTGGLRFPLCQFNDYDVVFRTIAGDVVRRSGNLCQFEIPSPPAGRTLDLDTIAVSVATEGAEPKLLGQALAVEACGPDAFVVQDGHIALCPQTCSAAESEPAARVEVLFTCQSTIIVR
jgi:hypothetical protein